ncbi:hypothetical protein N7495_001486 [Penicillium taxi]|uniref:uncharacterized protein n=1 Tax=Penicillium taxi TaxID=168475 RepID=UPI0025457031|nr:uncharacterized protein N7495_001486 [Penicillium taxi]KAJ5908804.1 hypothetical protein N7495_001486 [Penicillium taxi]
MSVHFNPRSREVYLRLPSPHNQIIITPHRPDQVEETAAVLTNILNDPGVYPWLEGPPYPYLHENGKEWVLSQCRATEPVVRALQTEFESSVSREIQPFFDICPFTCIREIQEEGCDGHPLKDTLIGDIGLSRYLFYEHPVGSEERAAAQQRNNAFLAGNEGIVWGLGDFLKPSHHGHGIMTYAMRTLISNWGVPRMNIHDLRSSAFVENQGSLKVFEKNNFERICTLNDWSPVSESRGGGRRSIVVVRWRGPV